MFPLEILKLDAILKMAADSENFKTVSPRKFGKVPYITDLSDV